jgi:hypothetical protein
MLVRARGDFQEMREQMDNRIGRKADGTDQDIDAREFREDHAAMFASIADAARMQEKAIEKMLHTVLKEFPVYTEFLANVKGVGDIAAGWIIGEYDIHKASNVAKLWQFTGLNNGLVPGKKRVENKDGSFSFVLSGEMVRGDQLTPGHVAPFNKRLRTAMVGVLADGFIKANIRYRNSDEAEYENTPDTYRRMKGKQFQVVASAESYGKIYLDHKHRLSQEVSEVQGGSKDAGKRWCDVSNGHRDRAAKRKMIKKFLQDLYDAWRTLEGLPVRKPYQEEYLGHVHGEAV